jgi:hypothetical protein
MVMTKTEHHTLIFGVLCIFQQLATWYESRDHPATILLVHKKGKFYPFLSFLVPQVRLLYVCFLSSIRLRTIRLFNIYGDKQARYRGCKVDCTQSLAQRMWGVYNQVIGMKICLRS